MATHLIIRPVEGDAYELAIDGTRFVEPDHITGSLDTADLWALPGLADAHAHLTMTAPGDISGLDDDVMRANIPTTAWAHVENGVLLILDKGGGSDVNLIAFDHDADLRPEMEAAGAIIRPDGGYMPGFGAQVEPDDLIEHVRTVASTRGGWIKIIGDWPRRGQGPLNNYTLEQLTEATAIAHAAGARVAIHTMAYSASDAVAAGIDSIEHGPFLTKDDLRILGERGGAWVPTMANMHDVLAMLGPESTGGKMFAEGIERMTENLPLAEELGVTVLAGTDLAIPHGSIAIEAARLRDHGLSDRAATDAASLNAYAYTGRTDTLQSGAVADAVFFRDNPYDDVSALARPALIIRRGQVIEPA